MNDYLWAKAREKGWVAKDADITQLSIREVLGSKMQSGELSLADYDKWCEEGRAAEAAKAAKVAESENRLQSLVAAGNKPVLDAVNALTGVLERAFAGKKPAIDTDTLDATATEAAKRFSSAAKDDAPSDAQKAFAAGAGADPRVKKTSEALGYSTTTKQMCYREDSPNHPMKKAGNPVIWFRGSVGMPAHMHGEPVIAEELSELQKAKAAAWYAWKAHRIFRVSLPEQVEGLVKEMLHEDRFVGMTDGPARKLTDFEIKAVLDDATSGGENAVPEWFDANIITTPLLYGELAPYVTIIPAPRGSAADGFSHGTPTFVGTGSGSAVSPFSTTSFISAFDTSFFPATCAIQWGLDFESDTLPNFGQSVMMQIGMEAQRWLDEQIAVGDGTTEPQGIFTASGTSVAAVNGTTGGLVYNDAINLVFTLGKAARNALGGNRVRFVMKDSQYKEFMQIVTGVTGDTRPIFGMNTQAYRLGEYPVSVQDNVAQGDIAFCNLAAYRLYRRQGLQFAESTDGDTLMRSNLRLVVARMRWGGKLTLPTTYCAQMTDADIQSSEA